jgi:hypothetical protein
MPTDSLASLGINRFILNGPIQDKLITYLQDKEDITISELSDDDYLLIRDILIHSGIDYKVIVNIPEINSPPSFLYEDRVDHVLSYDLLEVKPKKDTDEFLEKLGEEPDTEEGIEDESDAF